MTIDINYKDCTYQELIKIINQSRKELKKRGTTTKFERIHFSNGNVLEEFNI